MNPGAPGSPTRRAGSRRPWSSRVPAVPTRSRCSRSRSTPPSRRSPCTSTTDCGTESATSPIRCGAVATALGAAFLARVARSIPPGGNLEARARDARYALRRARDDLRCVGRARRAHRRRPGRDRAPQRACAAPRPPASRGWPHVATASSARCSACGGLTPASSVSALGLAVFDDPMNDDRAFRRVAIRHDVLPLLESIAERDLGPGARPAGRRVLRSGVAIPRRTGGVGVARRGGAPVGALRALPPVRWPAGRCASGWARRRRRWRRSTGCSRSRAVTCARPSSRVVEWCGGPTGGSSWKRARFRL